MVLNPYTICIIYLFQNLYQLRKGNGVFVDVCRSMLVFHNNTYLEKGTTKRNAVFGVWFFWPCFPVLLSRHPQDSICFQIQAFQDVYSGKTFILNGEAVLFIRLAFCSVCLNLILVHNCQEKLKFETIFSKFKRTSQEPLHQYQACFRSL